MFRTIGGATISVKESDACPQRTIVDFPFLSPSRERDEIGRLLHYRILRKLGEGGMGMVFAAQDSMLLRPAALKIIHPRIAGDERVRLRFEREAQAMAALTHDHIVTVYQVGSATTPDGRPIPFLAMQYLEGDTLEGFLQSQGRLPAETAARIGVEIARGLAAAHARGMIHRDIKPANIWLEAPSGRVKILDFGLARLEGPAPQLSANGQLIGTPSFMAPEQAVGERVDHRADLFSLGCVLYVMLTGELPFPGSDLMTVLTKLALEEPRPIRERAPETPQALVDLVLQLLSKKADQRPKSAEEVAQRLQQFAGGASLTIAPRPMPVQSQHHTAQAAQAETIIAGNRDGQNAQTMAATEVLRDRRRFLMGAGMAAAGTLGYFFYRARANRIPDADPGQPAPAAASGAPIVVGILHSQTGTLRDSENPVMEMTQLALEQLTAKGGLLGRPIKFVIRNGASDERVFAKEAEKLILHDKVDAIFGCWSSASRKAVKAVVEEHNSLLIYPVQYEGLERSPNIIYTGATPNQQMLPAVDWCLRREPAARFFLVGSDYIFPHSANEILRHRIEGKKGQIVGVDYLPLGSTDVKEIVARIKKAEPHFILNTINGSSNQAFFTALRAAGIASTDIPTLSFSVDEQVLRGMPPKIVAGDYAAWNYFESIPGPTNEAFVEDFRERWGEADAVTDPMEAAWMGVQFWAQAVSDAQSSEPADVRLAMLGQKLDAPEGPGVRIDPDTQHTWKYFRLGQITPDGSFKIVHQHDAPTPPVPYPNFRTPAEWEAFQNGLYREWGNRWSRAGE